MRYVGAYSVETTDIDEVDSVVDSLLGDDDTGEYVVFSVDEENSFILVSLASFPDNEIDLPSVPVPYAANSEALYETEWIDPPTSSLGKEILKRIIEDLSKDRAAESELAPSSRYFGERGKIANESLGSLPRNKSRSALDAAKKALTESGSNLVGLSSTKPSNKPIEAKKRERRPAPSKRGKARTVSEEVSSGTDSGEDLKKSREKSMKNYQKKTKETQSILDEFLG